MPFVQSRPRYPRPGRKPRTLGIATLVIGTICTPILAASTDPSEPLALRVRQIELHYRVSGTSQPTEVQLWYTRDRGATWQEGGVDDDQRSPVTFIAPAEGLYGFILIVRDGQRASQPPPQSHESPQRWVFIDWTPPLAQWDQPEPADNAAARRTLRLRWTAYDDYLPNRPISLWYQSSIDQAWRPIETALANLGRYDWRMPETLGGQITLKLVVGDLAGHSVERLLGPVPIEHWTTSLAATAPAGTGQVASPTAATIESPSAATKLAMDPSNPSPTPTATQPGSAVSLANRLEAEDLYRKGSWHLVRNQYPLAAERFREALERDPGMLAAMNDLAGIHHLQQEYDQALGLYQQILSRNDQHELALRGAALAYLGQKKYAQSRDLWQRLLKVNDKDAQDWLTLGDVLFLMGDVMDARAHWRQAAKVDRSASEVIKKVQNRLELYGAATPTPPAEARR